MQRKELINQLAKAAAAAATAKTLAVTFNCSATEAAMRQAEGEFTELGHKIEAGSMAAVFTPEEARELAITIVDGIHGYSVEYAHDKEKHRQEWAVAEMVLRKVTETKRGRFVHMGRSG